MIFTSKLSISTCGMLNTRLFCPAGGAWVTLPMNHRAAALSHVVVHGQRYPCTTEPEKNIAELFFFNRRLSTRNDYITPCSSLAVPYRGSYLDMNRSLKVIGVSPILQTYIHACIHTCMHTCMHTYVHAYMHAYIHTYIDTCIHTYM